MRYVGHEAASQLLKGLFFLAEYGELGNRTVFLDVFEEHLRNVVAGPFENRNRRFSLCRRRGDHCRREAGRCHALHERAPGVFAATQILEQAIRVDLRHASRLLFCLLLLNLDTVGGTGTRAKAPDRDGIDG